MDKLLIDLIFLFNALFLIYFAISGLISVLLLILAAENIFYYKVRRRLSICKKQDYDLLPGVSIVSVAFNRSDTIVESIESLRNINYPDYEIIIVNDGSKDKTLYLLKEKYQLFKVHRASSDNIETKKVNAIYKSALDSRLTLIDKEVGGVGDSLNCGLNYARNKLICTIDAYSILESNALIKMMQTYLERDAKIVGLTGTVKIANGCKIQNGEIKKIGLPVKLLAIMQVAEYARTLYCERAGWSKLNAMINTMGSFGLFEKKYIIEVGGYKSDGFCEQLDLALKLHINHKKKKRKYKIQFIPDTYCWSKVPEHRKTLEAQRNRWQLGIIDSICSNIRILCNPKFGLIGLIAIPYNIIFEIFGPGLELLSILVFLLGVGVGALSNQFIMLFLLLAVALRVMLSLTALLLEEYSEKNYDRPIEIVKIFIMALLENIGYRQLLCVWKFKALVSYCLRRQNERVKQRGKIKSL